MATLSNDLRERILAAYHRGEGTRQQIAERFEVSLGMVKKLIQQHRHTGDYRARHHRSGRKPKITAHHRRQLARLVDEQPDMTLEELRAAIGVDCTLPAIHYVLGDMGISVKKNRCAQASKTASAYGKREDRGSMHIPSESAR